MQGSAFLSDAPLAIVVTADQNQSDVWIEDTSIASTFIMLAAHYLDLGSCWIQIRKENIQSPKLPKNISGKYLISRKM